MLTDRYGLALSTASATARDAYVQACDLALTSTPAQARPMTELSRPTPVLPWRTSECEGSLITLVQPSAPYFAAHGSPQLTAARVDLQGALCKKPGPVIVVWCAIGKSASWAVRELEGAHIALYPVANLQTAGQPRVRDV
jgi:hypothetical protein